MKIVLSNAAEAFIGLSSGLIIGSAFIALLTFLGIIPRLIQLSQSFHLINIYPIPLVLGTLIGTYFTFLWGLLYLQVLLQQVCGDCCMGYLMACLQPHLSRY